MGTDFAVPQGTELRATTDGSIRVYLDNNGHGTGVDITNDNGIVIRNWHLSQVNVSNGDYVTAGQVIGLTGGRAGTWGAGNSTGPHLHWELRDNARFNDIGWIDPRGLTIYSFDGSAPAPSPAPSVGAQGEGIRGQGADWTYWVPGVNDQMTVQSRLFERGLYSGPIDGDLASDASVRAIKMACGQLGYFDLTYWDGAINKNLVYGMLLLAQNHGGYSGWNNLFTDGYVWAAFDTGVVNAIAVPTPVEPTPPVTPTPEPAPVPAPEPVKPDVKPEDKEHKEKPVEPITPISKEEIQAKLDAQQALVAPLKPADLGNIITNPKARFWTWALFGLTGLAIIGLMGGMTAARWIAPEWFIFATGAYTAIAPAFASLAMANINLKK
jgi:murein DD-endopeptidase MepM/ murein hydrolase activator NlpD